MNDIDFADEWEKKQEMDKYDLISKALKNEYINASAEFGKFNSPHEGYALLLEELEELWHFIKLKPGHIGRGLRIYEEALHVAAMAIRLIVDFGDKI